MRPWRIGIGFAIGLIVGGMIWWNAFEPGLGLFQKPQLIIVPAALGILIVILRNKWRRVGQFDPRAQAKNKRGRL